MLADLNLPITVECFIVFLFILLCFRSFFLIHPNILSQPLSIINEYMRLITFRSNRFLF